MARSQRESVGSRANPAARVRAALAHVAVASDHHDLACHHHVGGALDAVEERFATAVQVVELGLGDRVVDVDGGDEQLLVPGHFALSRRVRMTFISSTLVVDESGTLLVEIRWALECSPFFLTRPAECRYRSIGSFRKYSQKSHH